MSEPSYSKKKRAAFKLSTDPPRKQSVAAYHRHQTLHIGSGSVRSEPRKARSARGNGQSQKCKDMVPPLTPIRNLERSRIETPLLPDSLPQSELLCQLTDELLDSWSMMPPEFVDRVFPDAIYPNDVSSFLLNDPAIESVWGGRLHFISASTIATTVLTPSAEGLSGDPSHGRTSTEVHDAYHRYAEHIAPISTAATSVCPTPQDTPILIQPDFLGSPTWLSSSLHRSPADLSATDPSANDQEKVEDEEVVASWLNLLSKTIDYRLQERRLNRSVLCPQLQRMWSGSNPQTPIILHHVMRSRTIQWSYVQALCEVTRTDQKDDLDGRLARDAYRVFENQPFRRFVPALAIIDEHFVLYIFDRSGVLYTEDYPFTPANKPLFLRIIYSLMFAPLDYLGIDLSVTYPTNGYSVGGPITVRADESEYVIDDAGCNVFQSNCLQGRATSCWVVHEPGSDRKLLLKDSWCDKNWKPHELVVYGVLKKAIEEHRAEKKPVPVAIPIIEKASVVFVDSMHRRFDDTEHVRKLHTMFEIPQETTIRQHIRLILQNVGYPLTDFESRLELIEAIRDIVEAHRFLYSCNFVHRDLSLSNMLLQDEPIRDEQVRDERSCSDTRTSATSVHRRRRGLLIDFDHCAYVVSSGAPQDMAPGQERVLPTVTGTTPFMAVGVLHAGTLGTESASRFVHYPSYDLESILYVIIWLCIKYSGPGKPREENPMLEQLPTNHWYNSTTDISSQLSYAQYRDHKVAQLTNLNRLIFPWFEPYFGESMKQCAAHYVAALFGWPRPDVNLVSAFESSGPLGSMIANSAARWDDVSRVLEETATKLRREEELSTVSEIDHSPTNAQQDVSPGPVEIVDPKFILPWEQTLRPLTSWWIGNAAIFRDSLRGSLARLSHQ